MGGNIYWSTATDAHPVAHDFPTKWGEKGYEAGYLKYPTTDEIVLSGGINRRQEYQGGSIYWAAGIGAHTIQGAIKDRWVSLGAESGALGFPTSDETTAPDGVGHYNSFQNGAIYWTPATGAHVVSGILLAVWAFNNYERGSYGYPIADQTVDTNGFPTQNFQRKKMTVVQQADDNPTMREYQFYRDDTTYVRENTLGKFSGQVSYSSAPQKYPMSWGMRMSPTTEAAAAAGGSTPMSCEGYVNSDGTPTDYHYDKTGVNAVPVDYQLHSTVPNTPEGSHNELLAACEFAGKSGDLLTAYWSFDWVTYNRNKASSDYGRVSGSSS